MNFALEFDYTFEEYLEANFERSPSPCQKTTVLISIGSQRQLQEYGL
jgi:hypothetical protein